MLVLVEEKTVKPSRPLVIHHAHPRHLFERRRERRPRSHHEHLRFQDHASPRPDQHPPRCLRCVAASGLSCSVELVLVSCLSLHAPGSQVCLPRCSGVAASGRCHGHQVRECQPGLWSTELEYILLSPVMSVNSINCKLKATNFISGTLCKKCLEVSFHWRWRIGPCPSPNLESCWFFNLLKTGIRLMD